MSETLLHLDGCGCRACRQSACGEKLIEILGLRVKSNGRVNTKWGDKTPIGLYLTIQRIMEETQESKS
jgi:hypothetical protein